MVVSFTEFISILRWGCSPDEAGVKTTMRDAACDVDHADVPQNNYTLFRNFNALLEEWNNAVTT
jgi:hypothetical protein